MKPLLLDRVAHANGFINENVPFVIDPATLKRCWNLAPLPQLLDLALPPYGHTWLELEHGKLGALIVGTDSALVMTFFDAPIMKIPVIVMAFRDRGTSESGFIERVDFKMMVRPFEDRIRDVLIDTLLGYEEGERKPPYYQAVSVHTFEDLLQEHGLEKIVVDLLVWVSKYKGIVTACMAVLAAMAYGPAKKTVMAPSGRWMAKARHGYKSLPFISHTIVSIEMEEKLIHRTLRNAATQIRHREHDVRSHPRVIRRGRPDEYVVVVKSHKRGDPALGQVIHDAYETTRTERHSPKEGFDDR